MAKLPGYLKVESMELSPDKKTLNLKIKISRWGRVFVLIKSLARKIFYGNK